MKRMIVWEIKKKADSSIVFELKTGLLSLDYLRGTRIAGFAGLQPDQS